MSKTTNPTAPNPTTEREALRQQAQGALSAFLELAARNSHRYRYTDGFEGYFDCLLRKPTYSSWRAAGLVALVDVLVTESPIDDARAVTALVTDELEQARYIELHNHCDIDTVAKQDCAVCCEQQSAERAAAAENLEWLRANDPRAFTECVELLADLRQRVGGAS